MSRIDVMRCSSVAAIRIADPNSTSVDNGESNRAASPRIATSMTGFMLPPTAIHAHIGEMRDRQRRPARQCAHQQRIDYDGNDRPQPETG